MLESEVPSHIVEESQPLTLFWILTRREGRSRKCDHVRNQRLHYQYM